MTKSKFQTKGFTLIELLVTMAVIAILSSVLFLGRTGGEEKLALQRSAFQLVQDLREIQEMAFGAREESCLGGGKTYSFGIHFKKSWGNYYIIFKDCDGDHKRKGNGEEDLRKKDLEKGVEISDLSPSSDFSICFEPPDPTTYINQQNWNQEAVITLSLKSNQKKVKINSAGRIEIE